MKLIVTALLTLFVSAAEFPVHTLAAETHAAVAKRQKLVSLPKNRYESESAAVHEAERRNPGLKATAVINCDDLSFATPFQTPAEMRGSSAVIRLETANLPPQ